MSFIKNITENLQSQISVVEEENYQKLFPKITRDIASRDEMLMIINNLVQLLSEYDQELAARFSTVDLFTEAKELTLLKSKEYSENVKRPESKKVKYEDFK